MNIVGYQALFAILPQEMWSLLFFLFFSVQDNSSTGVFLPAYPTNASGAIVRLSVWVSWACPILCARCFFPIWSMRSNGLIQALKTNAPASASGVSCSLATMGKPNIFYVSLNPYLLIPFQKNSPFTGLHCWGWICKNLVISKSWRLKVKEIPVDGTWRGARVCTEETWLMEKENHQWPQWSTAYVSCSYSTQLSIVATSIRYFSNHVNITLQSPRAKSIQIEVDAFQKAQMRMVEP